ncbi:Prolipoprotein diacylglyceryl transferase [hydrothermal vent metagenome]|uniref:Prolipoprotein diacylglyceryl transferase n=1 Tax=hydrothermal vent metagenome TaxID=652676 RepID=A0A3B0WB34_9ZZZZ
MLAIAVVVCSFFLARDAKALSIKSEVIFDLVFCLVVSGVLGARLFFILLNLSFFINNPSEIIMIQNGGLAWQGGLIGAGLIGSFYVKKKGLPVLKMLDLCAPYIALGQAIGRIGCFLNGCCFGKQVPWGMYFPVHDANLHPTQLYLTGGFSVIFIILKLYQKKSMISGQVFVLYLVLAPMWRFIIEFFRADHTQTFLGLSVFQFMCLGIMGVGVYVYSNLKSFVGKK